MKFSNSGLDWRGDGCPAKSVVKGEAQITLQGKYLFVKKINSLEIF